MLQNQGACADGMFYQKGTPYLWKQTSHRGQCQASRECEIAQHVPASQSFKHNAQRRVIMPHGVYVKFYQNYVIVTSMGCACRNIWRQVTSMEVRTTILLGSWIKRMCIWTVTSNDAKHKYLLCTRGRFGIVNQVHVTSFTSPNEPNASTFIITHSTSFCGLYGRENHTTDSYAPFN